MKKISKYKIFKVTKKGTTTNKAYSDPGVIYISNYINWFSVKCITFQLEFWMGSQIT